MNTFRGYYNVTSKIVEDDYTFIDENRLINPKPMIFVYKELQWLKENRTFGGVYTNDYRNKKSLENTPDWGTKN